MEVGTTQAAFILNISTARVRVLLKEGRIQGARKDGRSWLIPLNSQVYQKLHQVVAVQMVPGIRYSVQLKRLFIYCLL